MKQVIYKYALKNAIEHGKANSKAVLGKVIAEIPDLRKNVADVLPIVKDIVEKDSMVMANGLKISSRLC